ncbi:MAG: DEAD/DEAH box helicase family protein [Candidatus Dadabacteria bacterium]|nr:DEAD/DEAH box helicase family protein [Candidatus Dadabacteria bacterium]
MLEKSKSLIINSPYSAPSEHWKFEEASAPPVREKGRRSAGYTIADPTAKPHQDRGKFIELELVNQIRKRVDKWRENNYPGVTGTTKALLEHWKDDEQRDFPFFFCQIEAIETLIWLIETPESERTGIEIPTDGGPFRRLCSKLATGTGKTVVMAMLIAWQAINRATNPADGRFSQNIFIVAPNLTIRERLAVLKPSDKKNYYDEFRIVPLSMTEKLRRAKVVIRNWHTLQWETEEKLKEKKGVDKRGAKSDEAYVREVLGEIASERNLIVINDEAHHAWRVPVESDFKKKEIEEATKWVGGLDRIHKARGILNCFDFSATPFAPSGKKTDEDALFGWIVSDFGLNDAIESGLVKTPRIVVRDNVVPDTKTFKPRLYHIFSDPDVKDDLNRKADEKDLLPDFVMSAYALLGEDWEKAKEEWDKSGQQTPPVMITVANRTETAARINYAFESNYFPAIPDALCEKSGLLHIDSAVLKKAEEKETHNGAADKMEVAEPETMTRGKQEDFLREKVNTVGQADKPGGRVQNVISVGMLSEGWDARTVTHIMGLRAFTSQLLCEQVVGRGLRRASYEINQETGLFDPEYVNVFGVPFSFLPHEDTDSPPPPPQPYTVIQPVSEKEGLSVSWPNVIRVDRIVKPGLSIDWKKVSALEINASEFPEIAKLAPTVDNKPDVSNIKTLDLNKLVRKSRKQTFVFRAAQTVWREQNPRWKGSPAVLMAELVRLADEFIDSDRIKISPELYNSDPQRRQVTIMLAMARIIRHFWLAIVQSNTEKRTLVLDENRPIRSTEDMIPWRTRKPYEEAKKSHINYCVLDSAWESSEAFELDRNKAVEAWAKNDHLGFDVFYVYKGAVKRYRPDFIIRLKSGGFLVLETKGQQKEEDDAKHAFMREWVEGVNENGEFGKWQFAVSKNPGDIKDILAGADNNKALTR